MQRFPTFGKQALVKGWQHGLALFLPPTCLGCQINLDPASPPGLCPGCYAQLPWWDRTRIIPPTLPPALTSFQAPLLYEGLGRDLILQLKFQDGTHLARTLARLMLPVLPQATPDNHDNLLLLPVPMHPRRLRQRLFNQSALLVRQMHHLTGYPFSTTALMRLVPSDGQARRTRAQRLRLPGSHFAATDAVVGKTILLIDDIYTTGATARACALSLQRAGASSVHVIALAYTPHYSTG